MPRKFVILSMPRSGTGFVYTALDSHPDVVCHGELFMPKRVGALSGKLKKNRKSFRGELTKEYRNRSPVEFLNTVLEYDPDVDFAGFKLFFPQNEEALRHVIHSRDYSKIVLRRDNLLAMYSSARTAQAGGQGKVQVGQEVKRVKIRFDESDFYTFKARHDKYTGLGRRLLQDSGADFLDVEYTEFSDAGKFDEIFRFLGAAPMRRLSPAVAKRNPSDILARFENPEEVRDFLERVGRPEWARESI